MLHSLHSTGIKPGEIHHSHHDIPFVDSGRKVRIYLPKRLRETDPPRPLVLMFDGQNVFHDEPSFAGGWHAHLAVERIARVKRPAPIVVAIDHEVSKRKFPDWSMGILYKLDVADRVEALLTSGQSSEELAIELLSEMNPDTVMGTL